MVCKRLCISWIPNHQLKARTTPTCEWFIEQQYVVTGTHLDARKIHDRPAIIGRTVGTLCLDYMPSMLRNKCLLSFTFTITLQSDYCWEKVELDCVKDSQRIKWRLKSFSEHDSNVGTNYSSLYDKNTFWYGIQPSYITHRNCNVDEISGNSTVCLYVSSLIYGTLNFRYSFAIYAQLYFGDNINCSVYALLLPNTILHNDWLYGMNVQYIPEPVSDF